MLKVAAAVILVSLTACLGDIPPDPVGGPTGGGGTARQQFDTNVEPIVVAECGSCHRTRPDITQFVDADPAKAYDRIVGITAIVGDFAPADAAILTKIALGHEGVAYSGDQLGKITAWLEKEVSERGGVVATGTGGTGTGGTTGTTALETAVHTWSGCLTLADFRTANMADTWGNLQTEDTSTCKTCHTNGGFGHVASDYETTFYNLVTKHSGYMLQYFAADTTDPLHPVMKINEFSFTQVSQQLEPHLEHPKFDPADGMVALQAWYTAASNRLATDQCTSPTLQD